MIRDENIIMKKEIDQNAEIEKLNAEIESLKSKRDLLFNNNEFVRTEELCLVANKCYGDKVRKKFIEERMYLNDFEFVKDFVDEYIKMKINKLNHLKRKIK